MEVFYYPSYGLRSFTIEVRESTKNFLISSVVCSRITAVMGTRIDLDVSSPQGE